MSAPELSVRPRPLVLVVDDEPLVGRALVGMLQDGEFDAIDCKDGEIALQLIATHHVDLVLLDMIMPRMNGLEVCKRLKSSEQGRTMPVVFLTAQGQTSDIVGGFAAGADGYLEKPVRGAVLRATLHALLRFRDVQRRTQALGAQTLQELLRERVTSLAAASALSRREQEVLELLLLGRTVSDIGLVLGISPRTAKFHQTNVLTKLGAESRFDLMRLLL